MKKVLTLAILLLTISSLKAQMEEPVKWSYGSKKISDTEVVLLFKATIDEGWHLYSAYQSLGGPVKTSFKFKSSKDYVVVGKITEPKPNTVFSQTFGVNVSSFDKEVIFQQKIKLTAKVTIIYGTLEFMACSDHKCLSPETVEFSIPIK